MFFIFFQESFFLQIVEVKYECLVRLFLYYKSLEMSGKQKIVLTQSHKYQFSHLLKHFKTATKDVPEYLQSADVFKILESMGFLPEQSSDQDHELVNTIAFMVAFPRGQGMTTQRNLFRFLMSLTQITGKLDYHFEYTVQPLPKDMLFLEEPLVQINIGSFNREGLWSLTGKQEQEIRQIFKRMIYTRASRNNIEVLKKEETQEEDHQPAILDRSRALAKEKFLKMGNSKVQDRLLEAKRISESKIQRQLRKSVEKEVSNCSFKPTINSMSFSIEKQNYSTLNRGELLFSKGKQYNLRLKMKMLQQEEQIEKMNRSSCSFCPDLNNSRQSLRYSVKRQRIHSVKNEELTVSRMRQAREQRDHLNQVKIRGYPAGVSWIKYLKETKSCIQEGHSQSMTEEVPSIALNLQNSKEKISFHVKDGQSLNDIVVYLYKKCKISSHLRGNLLNLVTTSINSSGKAVIREGKICLQSEALDK